MASGTEIFRLFGSIFIDSSQAEASLSKTETDAKNVQDSFAGAVAKGQIMGNVVTKIASSMLDVATNVAKTGIAYNAEIEKYSTGFANMLGSAEKAQEVMAAIQEDAARTPFNVSSLTQANQLLISAGENAEYSRKVIMALGDAVSATGGGNVELSRMAGNLQQIANVGKATAVDIKQFANAGINIYQVLADYTGKTVQEVQNMTISYDLLSEALIAASEEGGRYYNAMDTQSQTMNGRVSTLKDNVSQLAGLMTQNLSEGVGQVVSRLNELTVAAIDAYKQDGWIGLGKAIANLNPITQSLVAEMGIAGNAINRVAKNAVSVLDQWSYKLNKFLGKEAYAGYDTYEDYRSDRDHQNNQERRRQEALAGKGISNKSWSERQAEAAAAAGNGKSSIATPSSSSTGSSGKSSSSAASAAKKTAQIIDTLTQKSEQVANGITTAIQTVQNKYDDGTEHITRTVTKSGTEIVDGVARNYKTVTTYLDNVQQKVEKTVEDIDTSVSAVQSRIEKNLSEAKSRWKSGILGTLQDVVSDLKSGNWNGLAIDFAKLVWGEVTPEQREIISKWAVDALTAINESYSGGGAKAAYESIKALFTNGIAADATEAKTAVQSFGEILDGLGASGGVGEKLAGIATSFSSMSGSVISSLGGIVSFITANPILAAILGITALAGGIGLAALSKKSKGSDSVTGGSYDSPFSKTPIYDSLAEFSSRADSLSRYSTATVSPFSSQQDSTGKQQLSVLQRISNSLDEHLPAIGTGQVVFDTGAVAGALRPALVDGIDTDLGTRAKRKARGG